MLARHRPGIALCALQEHGRGLGRQLGEARELLAQAVEVVQVLQAMRRIDIHEGRGLLFRRSDGDCGNQSPSEDDGGLGKKSHFGRAPADI